MEKRQSNNNHQWTIIVPRSGFEQLGRRIPAWCETVGSSVFVPAGAAAGRAIETFKPAEQDRIVVLAVAYADRARGRKTPMVYDNDIASADCEDDPSARERCGGLMSRWRRLRKLRKAAVPGPETIA